MKLIIYSIICGFLGVIIGNAGGGLPGAVSLGLISFFSPGLYILNKLYENSK